MPSSSERREGAHLQEHCCALPLSSLNLPSRGPAVSAGNPLHYRHALPDSPPCVMEGTSDPLIHTWDTAAFTQQGLGDQPSFPLILPSSPSIHRPVNAPALFHSSWHVPPLFIFGTHHVPLGASFLTQDFDICLKVLLSTTVSSTILRTSFCMSVPHSTPPEPPRQ